jgi:RHS repeat-associated protein
VLSAHVTDAFGATKTSNYVGSSSDDPFAGFGGSLGYMRESGLDLYRCGLRFYDVANARWLTRDPIGYGGGQNLYGYVSGNPVMAVDPDGLTEDSPKNKRRRARIAAIAVKIARNPEQAISYAKDRSVSYAPSGSWKCNIFVGEVLKQGGINTRTIPIRFKSGRGNMVTDMHYPTAGQWGSPKFKIDDWRVLRAGEQPQPGDVGAFVPTERYRTATGHTGIAVPQNYDFFLFSTDLIGFAAAHGKGVYITPFLTDPNERGNTIYRRYIGE